MHRERSGLTTTCGCLFGFVYKRKPTHLERFIREESSQRAPPFFVDGGSINLRRNQRKKTRFEIPRILAKYRRLAMHVKEMQPSVSVLDATDRERTQRIVASFIINLFKSLSESAQDFDSQQPFTRSPPFAPPLIRCARQGQAAAAARRLCAHVALVRSLT